MIIMLCLAFMLIGTLFLSIDIIIPFISTDVQTLLGYTSLLMPIQIMGAMFVIIGFTVMLIRQKQAGTLMFSELPSGKVVPLLHSRNQGKDPDAVFMKGKRLDLEVIRAKNKLFKDVGGGFRIAGHGCRRTYETIGFTCPEWLSTYFRTVKEKYGLNNSDEWRELRKQLSTLKDDVDKETQLNDIKLLVPIMSDAMKKHALMEMSFRELRNMEELLFDGITHNGDEVELFIDSATPNEQDVLEHQTFLNEIQRYQRYRDRGDTDWSRYVLPFVFLMIGAALAFMMLKGAM